MGTLVSGLVLLAVAFFLRLGAATVRPEGAAGRPVAGGLRIASYVAILAGVVMVLMSMFVVVDAGRVGVRHAFGFVDPKPLMPGVRFVTPWSSVERYTTREEQYPFTGDQVEEIAALSKEQMGMTVDVGVRWQIDPQQSAHIYTEIGNEDQIHSAVRNAIRKGVRDALVQYSINDISKRTQIARTMEELVDSALVTQPRAGGPPFRIATVTAFFLRDLQPPAQVVQAINNKIAQEQQRLLNTTLTPEALTRQYLEVLRDMKTGNNLVILVPTQGGIPILNIGDLRRNLR